MEFWIKASQLLLSLSILVILHELGHFIPAKLFKTKVEKFYLFFDPWFSLLKFKKGDTEYGIGWVPLGGYVKIAGMVDESMDTEQLEKEPEPWEFRSKPAWQRLIIMLGGVVVNLIVGFLIYAMVLFVWGKEYLPANHAKYGVNVSEYAKTIGFEDGDKIISLNNSIISDKITYSEIFKSMMLSDTIKTIQVVGDNGTKREITLPENFDTEVLANGAAKSMFQPRALFLVDSIVNGSIAANANFKNNDRIMGIDDIPTPYFMEFRTEIQKYKGEKVNINIQRDGQSVSIPVQLDSTGLLGIYNEGLDKQFDLVTKEYTFAQSIPAGFNLAGETIKNYLQQFKLVFTKEGIGELRGFGGIGSLFPSVWDWQSFWSLTAFLSLVLAVMNILPIPALDGGHVLFLLYEMIAGKAPSTKFLEKAQMVGMIILLTLLIYANGNDIIKTFFK